MAITNTMSGTTVDEIGADIYRISTPITMPSGMGFSFNQFLIVDDAPLLFHTGPRRLFPFTKEAIASVIPVERLRYIGFSHHEADEDGALLELLALAEGAEPVCSRTAAMVSVSDMTDTPIQSLDHNQVLDLGTHRLRWLDMPHLPHSWECGYLFDDTSRTLFCGDLFTQGGTGMAAVTEGDILEPSEAMRQSFDYFAHSTRMGQQFDELIALQPTLLAPMHGSSYRGDGSAMLSGLKARLVPGG